MPSTRVRYDASRKVGNANAVAVGVDLTRVVVISDCELVALRHLAQHGGVTDDGVGSDADGARAAEEQRRKAVLQQRIAEWPDTTEARHETFVRDEEAKQRDAEQRRVAMDELHAQKDEMERRTAVTGAALARLRDDARVRNAASVLLLDVVMRERDAQVTAHAQEAHEAQMEARQERTRAQLDDWAANAAEVQHKMKRREANVNTAQANMQMVQHQVGQRRHERVMDKAERAYAEEQASNEAKEKAAVMREQRSRAAACAAYNTAAATLSSVPAQEITSPSTLTHITGASHARGSRVAKLRERVARDAAITTALQEQTEALATLHAAHDAAATQRRAQTEQRLRENTARIAALYAQPSVTARTQERFASSSTCAANTAEVATMGTCGSRVNASPHHAACATRVGRQDGYVSTPGTCLPEANRTVALDAQLVDHGSCTSSSRCAVAGVPRKAAIVGNGGGFLSAEDERTYTQAMRQLTEQWRSEEAVTAQSRRAAAEALAREQLVQAQYKRVCEAHTVADEQASAQAMREREAAEAAACQAYIAGQLPDSLPSTLRRKAMQQASV